VIFYLTFNDWLEKKFMMKQGEVVFAVKKHAAENSI